MADHTRLRALAEKATAGPWMLDATGEDEPQINYWAHRFIGTAGPDADGYHWVVATSDDGHGPNAEYIAAASPDVVLGLLDEVDELGATLARLRALGADIPTRINDAAILEAAGVPSEDVALIAKVWAKARFDAEDIHVFFERGIDVRPVTEWVARSLDRAETLDRLMSALGLTETDHDDSQLVDNRNPECVKAWPECESSLYDPRCCRFPKSCSAGRFVKGGS